jgi:hypothetical protein
MVSESPHCIELLERISQVLATQVTLPPHVGQWAAVVGPGPCPPWPGLIWQPPNIEHALDMQILWAFFENNDLSQNNWGNALRICHKKARPGGYLVVVAPRPWPWGLKQWGWGCSSSYWRHCLIAAGWRIQQKMSIGGTPNWLQWTGLGAAQIWVCMKYGNPPLNLTKTAFKTIVSGSYQAKTSHFQG